MDILLTHGYFLEEDEHEKRVMKPYPPLGILSLSAYLKTRGFDVAVFDSTFHRKEDFASYVSTHRPTCVGIYCNLMTKLNVLRMIRLCKMRSCHVVVGGPEPSSYAAEFLGAGADVVVLGEGELSTESVLHEIARKGVHCLHNVQGIAFSDEAGSVVKTRPRPLIADLDTLPFPDRDSIDIKKYVAVWRKHHHRGSISLITARGCPYTCTWCSHGVYGFSHRRRSPRNVVDEIAMIREQYNPDMLWIADDVFTINHKWLREYAAELKRHGLEIPFECISRADRVNAEIAGIMADLRCFRIWLGSESGSQQLLDAMSRGVTVEEIQKATRLFQGFGVEVGLFVMVGYIGESIKDIEATIDHLKTTQPNTFLTTLAYPIKGTAYHEKVEAHIATDASWDKRTERDNKVRGRHSDLFYWFAQRRLTNEVLLHSLRRKVDTPIADKVRAYVKSRLAHVAMLSLQYSKS